MVVKRKVNPKQLADGVKNGDGKRTGHGSDSDSKWSFGTLFNLLCGVAVMLYISYKFSYYMYELHENNMWFSNIKEVEREISFRTEMGLYYSYYKQVVQSKSLWQGVKDLTQDKLTEHPDTINIMERMNIYQEVFLAAIYRTFGIKMPAIFFYTYSIFAINGLLVASLYAITWMLSGSWLAGLLSAAFFAFNRTDMTRVAYTAPLRESFALPFLWLQGAAITFYFQSKSSQFPQRVSKTQLLLLLATLLFCLFWQFNQFIMMLQGFALFGVWVLGLAPASKVAFVVVCQQISLFAVCLLQFGNTMILASLAMSFNFGFLAILAVFGNRFRPTSVVMHIIRVGALSILSLVAMVLLSSLFKIIFQVDSDEHIFKFLQNKFGVGDERDFDSRLYLCLSIFQFISVDVIKRLTEGFVFPFYVVAHVGIVGYLVKTTFSRWWSVEKVPEGENKTEQTSESFDNCNSALFFHTVQAVFFLCLAIITERMKYLWTPYVCVLAAVGIADTAVWDKLCRLLRGNDTLKASVTSSAAIVLILGIMTSVMLPPALKELNTLREFFDPDTVELMEWISKNTPAGSSFTGSMQLLAAVKLSTGRPITNHPHYEDKYLRYKTKQLYQIYGKRTPDDVSTILKSYKSNYIILEDSICRAPASSSGCRKTDMIDIDNGVQPDDPKVKIPGLVKTTVPSFCENVRHQKPPYSKYFKTVFVNKTFRIYEVL